MGNLYEIYCADGKVDGNKKMKSFFVNKLSRQFTV